MVKSIKEPIKNGYVQFDSASIVDVKFKKGFGPEEFNGEKNLRQKYNMKVFDELAAEQWNKSIPNDLPDKIKTEITRIKQSGIISGSDVNNIRKQYKYTWHECENTYSAQLVPSELHNSISHAGGVSVVNQMSIIQQKQRIKDMIDYLITKGRRITNIT